MHDEIAIQRIHTHVKTSKGSNMFTGIVQGQATILSVTDTPDQSFRSLAVKFPDNALDRVTKGASIALNGTCLTVTKFDTQTSHASFDVILETLNKTNLGELKVGDNLNFERAARYGDEIGGHIMSGHVFGAIELIDVLKTPSNVTLVFKLPREAKAYVLTKGFVGLNGCSLTVGQVGDDRFNVHLIPETLDVTTFGMLSSGAKVNLELDASTQAIVETVQRFLESRNINN